MNNIKYMVAILLALLLFNNIVSAQDTSLAVTSSGNVGIGTTNPQAKLQVNGNAILRADGFLGNASGASTGLQIIGKPGTFEPSLALDNGSQQWNIASWSDNSLIFVKSSGTTFTPFTIYNNSFQNELVLAANGVGIGVTNPQEKLQVAGTIYTTNGGIKFPDGTVQSTAASSETASGIEYKNIGSSSDIPTTMRNLASITLNCPSSGYVQVTLSGDAVLFGDNTVVDVGIGTSSSAMINSARVGRLDGSGTLRYSHSFSTQVVVPVNAGSNTIYALAQKESVFSANTVNLGNLYIVGTYYPKKY